MVRKALSDNGVFELRPEGLKERAAETKGVFQAKAKTWDRDWAGPRVQSSELHRQAGGE